ncbi:MAG: hypothetical protein R3C20_15370 [Planctomycetaceae bacterium]
MAFEIIACPKCGQRVVPKSDGRCPSCQERITKGSRDDNPSPVQASSGPRLAASGSSSPPPSASQDEEKLYPSPNREPQTASGGRVSKGLLVFGVLLVLVGAPLLVESLLGDPGPAMRASRRARSIENLLGPRTTLLLSGVVTLAVGLYMTHSSVRRTKRRGRAVGYGLALAAAVTGASFIAVPKAVKAREHGRLHQVVEEIRFLCKTDSVADEWQKFPIGEKLIIWDCANDDFHPAYEKLPDSRRGSSGDREATYLLILGQNDEKDTEYESGELGYRRTLQIGLVDWPDKNLLGVFEIEGNPPPSYLTRRKDDVSRIVGDTTAPILRWIERQTSSK